MLIYTNADTINISFILG